MKKEKVKDYTEHLIGAVNKSTGQKIKEFFFGSGKTTNCYRARHRTDNIRLLWMEAARWGTVYCYPCALETEDEILVFETGAALDCKENNARLVKKWTGLVNQENIVTDYEVEELKKDDFYDLFKQYRKDDLDRAIARAERENGIVHPEEAEEEAPPAQPPEPAAEPEDTPLTKDEYRLLQSLLYGRD